MAKGLWLAAAGCAAALIALPAAGQQAAVTPAASPPPVAGIPVNFDEAKVGAYVLPDPLVAENGEPVRDAGSWISKRRPEIVRLFEENQHGKAPGRPSGMVFDVHEAATPAFGGKAIRKQIRIYFRRDRTGPVLNLLSYVPAAATAPVPLLLNISFSANSATVADPGIAPGLIWSAQEHKRIPAPTDGRFPRIDILPLLDAGFGFATFYYGDVDPDDATAMPQGIRQRYLKPGRSHREPDEWGAIAAWAWGISRAVDYLETEKAVDAARIALTGMSRLGKTALWAGARDTRIAAVIASVSGEGGAAISRRNFGETIAHYVAPSRYWYHFAANYARYAADPASAPIDGNLLVALIAPRPLLLQTGSTDNWSDPKGEFLSAVDAGRVYALLGKKGLGTNVWPEPGQVIGGDLAYYMHAGGHGPLKSDWPVFIAFLKANLKP